MDVDSSEDDVSTAPAGLRRRSYLEFPTPNLLGVMLPVVPPAAVPNRAGQEDGPTTGAVSHWAAATADEVLGPSAIVEARQALRKNLVGWAYSAALAHRDGSAFVCLRGGWPDGGQLDDPDGSSATPADRQGHPESAYVYAALEWEVLADWQDVPTVAELVAHYSRGRLDQLRPADVEVVELPVGSAVKIHAFTAVSAGGPGAEDSRSLAEESLTVAVVFPGAGAAAVTGTWPTLWLGERMIEVVTAAAAAMRMHVADEPA